MRKTAFRVVSVYLIAVTALALVSPGSMLAETRKPVSEASSLKVGAMAPDFKLAYFDGTGLKYVTLSQYRGKQNVIVAFYIFAFTGG
jgi:hypothetical protein